MPPDFYTPLAEAVPELAIRRENRELEKRIHTELALPLCLLHLVERPHIVMFRQVLTPLHETMLFLKLAKKYNLTPFVIEYYQDTFVSTGNPYKRGLGKLPIHKFTGIQNIEAYEYKTIVDFNSFVGKSLIDVRTKNDESLIAVHHDLFKETTKIDPQTVAGDASLWFKRFGKSAQYYEHFLKLFVRDSILFETFLTNGEESKLTFDVVLPAYRKCIADTDHKPLIVHATYEDTDSDPEILNHYPKIIAEILSQKGYS